MKEFDKLTPRKKVRDEVSYRRGFEEGGFAGAMAVALILLFVVFVIIPMTG